MKFQIDDLPMLCQDTSVQSNQNSWRIGSSTNHFDRYELFTLKFWTQSLPSSDLWSLGQRAIQTEVPTKQ
jgi:hypothetical protein